MVTKQFLSHFVVSVVESCHKAVRQRQNQKVKEPILYKIKSGRIKYILVNWVGENLVEKGGIFKSTLWHTILYYTKLKLKKCFNLVYVSVPLGIIKKCSALVHCNALYKKCKCSSQWGSILRQKIIHFRPTTAEKFVFFKVS